MVFLPEMVPFSVGLTIVTALLVIVEHVAVLAVILARSYRWLTGRCWLRHVVEYANKLVSNNAVFRCGVIDRGASREACLLL